MRASDYTDGQWAEAHSGLAPSVLRQFEAMRETDDVEADDMDRFQDAEGHEYRVTVDYTMPTKLEAQMLADLIRDTVRRNEYAVPCPACGGRGHIGGLHVRSGGWSHSRTRRCTACKDGTIVPNPAVVTFEALRAEVTA